MRDLERRLLRLEERAANAPDAINVIWRPIIGAHGECASMRAWNRRNPSAGDLMRNAGETLDAFQARALEHFRALERGPIILSIALN